MVPYIQSSRRQPSRRRRRRQPSESEAEEENVLQDDLQSESEGSGENLEDYVEEDYRVIPELDVYEQEGIDEDQYSDMDFEARVKAEQEMEERELASSFERTRLPQAMLDTNEQTIDLALLSRHRAMQHQLNMGMDDDEVEQEEMAIDPEDAKGKLKSWIKEKRCVRWICRQFERFLTEYQDSSGNFYYESVIADMCSENKQSLEVDYKHLSSFTPTIALWVADEPQLILPVLNETAFRIATQKFNAYSNIFTEIFVRIKNLPIRDQLRNLRYTHLFKLIRVTGVVTRRTGIFPHLKVLVAFCAKCGEKKGPIYNNTFDEPNLGSCGSCNSRGPYNTSEESIYRNYQRITLQESPENVPAGRVPMHKEVILLGDLIDIVRAGEIVDLTGIFVYSYEVGLNIKHSFPVFATIIEAVSIRPLHESELGILTDEDKFEIRAMAQRPDIGQQIIQSIAPSIYGHRFIKTAIALSMFGGQRKDINGKHKIRGDINVLLLGDPGVAKSQFLKYVQKTAPRTVYTTGKGASAVGLTAGVHKDPITQEWVLEGGAMVLADNGVCLIDEFDKMDEQDRTSIHEAMEQQTISVAKAGIVTTLQAKCAVIAAANPVGGRYDSTKNFMQNVDLTEPILSRFDILVVIKDEVNLDVDKNLATFVINSHINSNPEQEKEFYGFEGAQQNIDPPIPQIMLKKYILYARQFVKPQILDVDMDKITKFYSEIRQFSAQYGGMVITVRHIESLVRMAEAHARMHLRDVREEDIDVAISILLESYAQSQKYNIQKELQRKFRQYLNKIDEPNALLLYSLQRIFMDKWRMIQSARNIDLESMRLANTPFEDLTISIEELEKEAREKGVHDITGFLNSDLFNSTYIFSNRVIRRRNFE